MLIKIANGIAMDHKMIEVVSVREDNGRVHVFIKNRDVSKTESVIVGTRKEGEKMADRIINEVNERIDIELM